VFLLSLLSTHVRNLDTGGLRQTRKESERRETCNPPLFFQISPDGYRHLSAADYAPGFEVCCLTRLLGPGGGCRGMEAARSGLFVNLRTQSALQRSSVRQRGRDDRFCSNHRR
jgi:hypothetical protein